MSPFNALDGGGGWLESRVDTRWTPESDSSRAGYSMLQSATNPADSQTFTQFRFAAAKSIRTSTVILASFNTIAAFATAVGILVDTYHREKRENKRFRFSRNGFSFVPATEAFPLILSVGIVVQGITFAVAQSTGLGSLFGSGCTLIAVFMLPAVFIVPYIQLVFGLEVTIRGLLKKPFAPRGRWNVTICLSVVGLLLLLNLLVAIFDRSSNFCLTSLFWFVAHYSVWCFGLLVGISGLLLVCVVVIFVRLHRSNKIALIERAAASRMVYYMTLAIISEAFMIPYFYVIAFDGQRRHALNLSMVTTVVANISGLMTGGLYLFLKSNTISTIGPKNKDADYENRREGYNKTERYESGGLDFDSHIMRPVTSPGQVRRMGSNASLLRTAKDKAENSPTTPTFLFRAPTIPQHAQTPSAASHMRKESYSLFPIRPPTTRPCATPLPSITYAPAASQSADADTLKPPPSMGFLAARGHRRNSSLCSSATVQIGLRLSSVEDVSPLLSPGTDVHTISCPKHNQKDTTKPERRQPPRLITDFDTPIDREFPSRGSMNTKPEEGHEQLETLSPTVYDPKSPAEEPVLLSAKVYTPTEPAERKLETLSPKVYSPTGSAEEVVTLSAKTYSPTTPTKAKLPSPRSPVADGGELLSSARYTP
ncbi:hypothetical protein GE21DRAFT_7316 [Neurospora crassa]|uniref:Uncharacterized protein n=1 Tax=Neurospora crassa (strain ATCC 24698 / 74-OR23-1A / CBS 708.71 / DSM 1257 / FGSC 987) TaxID=367110 RepID=Q1K7C2_NEUCR|nr:hypothetical protein NCU03751 [Neurospora crassa OR74A]EAA31862.3 hypothetical protein NCU03751 [Neurospora crassa OR74A]KHE88183.1 hypothetical protein GE21DRAFT_7316 [Neurospora crassa]|eukprot:XP_961098.3 hypothetical protein NCU03751 [Neurospora crassa OR74A]